MTVDPENIKAILATQFQDFGKGEEFHDAWNMVAPPPLLPPPLASLECLELIGSSWGTGSLMLMDIFGLIHELYYVPNFINKESPIYMFSKITFRK